MRSAPGARFPFGAIFEIKFLHGPLKVSEVSSGNSSSGLAAIVVNCVVSYRPYFLPTDGLDMYET